MCMSALSTSLSGELLGHGLSACSGTVDTSKEIFKVVDHISSPTRSSESSGSCHTLSSIGHFLRFSFQPFWLSASRVTFWVEFASP